MSNAQIFCRNFAAWPCTGNLRHGRRCPRYRQGGGPALQPLADPGGGIYRDLSGVGDAANGIGDALAGERWGEKTWQDAVGVPFSKGQALRE